MSRLALSLTLLLGALEVSEASRASGTLSAGFDHNVAVVSGQVWSWGGNTGGKLGNGTATDSTIPVRAGSLTNVIYVAAGMSHTLAVKSDGTVWAWGLNDKGQLGYSTATTCAVPFLGSVACSKTPQQVSGLTNVIAVGAGWGHSMALKGDGTVWTWGINESGQLGYSTVATCVVPGQGTLPCSTTPQQVTGITTAVEIAAGYFHSVVRKSTNTVAAWGRGTSGELGNGGTSSTTPVTVGSPALANVVAISARGAHTLARKSDNTAWAWGWNQYGQIGDGDSSFPPADSVFPAQVLTNVVDIAAGFAFSFARKNDGTVWAWGLNHIGQLGEPIVDNPDTDCGGDADKPCERSPIEVTSLANATVIAAGGAHTLTVRPDTSLVNFGDNASGQLGNLSGNYFTSKFSTSNYDPEISMTPTGTYGDGSSVGSSSSAGGLNLTNLDDGFGFALQQVNTSSAAQPMTLTNQTLNAIPISGIAAGGEFSASNNCGSSLASNVSCTINVTFTPAGIGVRTGTLTVNSGAVDSSTVTITLTGLAATVPGAPTIGTATAGNAQATVTFTPPASDGGSPITSYTVFPNPGSTGTQGATSPITVTGLTNGTPYTFTVRATNAFGMGAASGSSNSVAPGGLPVLSSVVSRKRHGLAGTFNLPVVTGQPIDGSVTVEPRVIGSGHTIVFAFSSTITSPGTPTCVDAGANPVGSVAASASGNEVSVTLTSIPDDKRVTVSVTNVNGQGVNASASLGFLVGDVNGSRTVTASDILRTKGHSGTATSGTYLYDVDVSGAVNSSDITAVKQRSGLAL